jgi:hypothetical protein
VLKTVLWAVLVVLLLLVPVLPLVLLLLPLSLSNGDRKHANALCNAQRAMAMHDQMLVVCE